MTLPALLADRLRIDATGPLVTFYDDATGERTELSAVTFDNWVAKTANLLVDGLGLGPGDDAVLALPLHWQSLVVAAGCWAAGLTVGFEGTADVAFVDERSREVRVADERSREERVADQRSREEQVVDERSREERVAEAGQPSAAADEIVVLSLRPLGAGLATPDASVTDFATEVRVHGDRFTGSPPGRDDEAFTGVTHADLAAAGSSAERVLLAPDGDPRLDRRWLQRAYVEPLAGGGSVVLCRHADPALLSRRREAERAV
ncbi:MAG TPA: TIGR03089 family protein [Mycobacteriales bacterium]